jgi:hypothetical protein
LRHFIRASARRLGGYDFVTLILDGKSFGSDEMVIALGVTGKGKIVLGFIQTRAENERVCREMLERLLK